MELDDKLCTTLLARLETYNFTDYYEKLEESGSLNMVEYRDILIACCILMEYRGDECSREYANITGLYHISGDVKNELSMYRLLSGIVDVSKYLIRIKDHSNIYM